MRAHLETARGALAQGALLVLALACARPEPPAAPSTDRGLIVLPAGWAESGSAPGELADVALDPAQRTNFHDFGRVPCGEVAEHTFHLLNTDRLPVTIRKMNASCGCTVPAVRYRGADGALVEGEPARAGDVLTVPPGSIAELSIRIDTRGVAVKNRDKLVSVLLTTSSQSQAFVRLEAHVIADLAFRAAPEVIDLGRVAANGGGSGSTVIVQDGGSGAELVGIASTPADVEAELVAETVFGKQTWRLSVMLLPPHPPSLVVRHVQLAARAADGGAARTFEVGLRAHVVADVEVVPARLVLKSGQSGEVVVEGRLPGQRLRLIGGALEGELADRLELTWHPTDPDDAGSSPSWTVTLTRVGELGADVATGKVRLELDDAQFARLEFDYVVFRE